MNGLISKKLPDFLRKRIRSLRPHAVWALVLAGIVTWAELHPALSQDSGTRERLSRNLFKSGEATLAAFLPVSQTNRLSVVKLDVNGSSVALAAVISANGLVLTKASEIGKGKLTCWLPGGREVGAELLRTDEENDMALVKVDAEGLQPVEWDTDDTVVGQWVVTPGVSETPQAVGIVSVPARKILHRRALVGVVLDMGSAPPKVTEVMNGLGAQKAGIKAGDRILAVNDVDVADREDLMKRLRQLREGQTVKLRIQRESERFDASIQMSVPSAELTGFPDRSDRMNRMGSLPSARAEGFGSVIQHDTVLQAWQCGGPLVNLAGKAIGLNIARAGRVATYALPAELVQQIRDRLQAPEPRP